MSVKKLYKAKELAEILGVNIQTVYRLGKRGQIETIKVGRSVRFLFPELDNLESDFKLNRGD